jgi:hypothetical protein
MLADWFTMMNSKGRGKVVLTGSLIFVIRMVNQTLSSPNGIDSRVHRSLFGPTHALALCSYKIYTSFILSLHPRLVTNFC